tara:strand:+ start:89 stop:736 length:648 start_codon:yes stop_codon:yes gene_type:complete
MIYYIGDVCFTSKVKCRDYTRKLLKEHKDKTIKQGDEIYDYLINMINLHPNKEEKIGDGIVSFEIKNDFFNNIALYINQITLKNIPVSWVTICNFKGASATQCLNEALRQSINYQIFNYKTENNYRSFKCEICKSPNNIDIDHVIQFKQLKEDFLKIAINPIPTTFDKEPLIFRKKFKEEDINFKREWDLYHETHAILRPLCHTCNLSRLKYKTT